MASERNLGSTLWAGIVARWGRLDRGWRAVVLGLAIVGLQWLLQTI